LLTTFPRVASCMCFNELCAVDFQFDKTLKLSHQSALVAHFSRIVNIYNIMNIHYAVSFIIRICVFDALLAILVITIFSN